MDTIEWRLPDDIPAARRQLRARGRQTMERLLHAGLEVFAGTGYDEARVDDVVARSGTSHGTFYLYFANKDDLLRTLAMRCADEMLDLARAFPAVSPGSDGVAALRAWLDRFLTIHGRYLGVIRAWMESHADDRLASLGRAVMGDVANALLTQLAGIDRDRDLPVELRATALLALLERCSYLVATTSVDLDRGRLLDTLAPMLHRGFFQPAKHPPLRPLVTRAAR